MWEKGQLKDNKRTAEMTNSNSAVSSQVCSVMGLLMVRVYFSLPQVQTSVWESTPCLIYSTVLLDRAHRLFVSFFPPFSKTLLIVFPTFLIGFMSFVFSYYYFSWTHCSNSFPLPSIRNIFFCTSDLKLRCHCFKGKALLFFFFSS